MGEGFLGGDFDCPPKILEVDHGIRTGERDGEKRADSKKKPCLYEI